MATLLFETDQTETTQGAPGTATTGDPGAAGTEGAPPPSGPPGGFLIPAVAMFAIFYFLLIRPEKKRRRQTEEMLGAVKKGDRVMTTSGMLAQVAAIHEDEVTLQVDEGVRIKFAKSAIQNVLDKGGDSKES